MHNFWKTFLILSFYIKLTYINDYYFNSMNQNQTIKKRVVVNFKITIHNYGRLHLLIVSIKSF